jgi:hypothetical protein
VIAASSRCKMALPRPPRRLLLLLLLLLLLDHVVFKF